MCATLQVSNCLGKRTTRSTINNLSTDSNSSLLLIYDERSGKYFLIDTGSELSVIPPSRSNTRKTCSHYLIAANGSQIKSFGTRQMMLNLGLQKYSWRFIIADVTQPIMGADFLRSHSLLVDLANERLIRTDNLKTIKGSQSKHKSLHISSIKSTN